MRLTKTQATALAGKITKDLQNKRNAAINKIIDEYVPSKEYKKFDERYTAAAAALKECSDLVPSEWMRALDNKEFFLKSIRTEELQPKFKKVPSYDLSQIHSNLVIATIECTDLDQVIASVIKSCEQ